MYLTISKFGNVENILQYHLKNLFLKVYRVSQKGRDTYLGK